VKLAGRVETGHARHRDVDDRQIHVLSQAELQGLGAVTGFADYFQVWLRLEHHAQPATDDGVIVDEQNAGFERDHRVTDLANVLTGILTA
jgi:hypothetical protein